MRVGLDNELWLENESFTPGVIAVFFEFNLVFAWVEVEGGVGSGCELAVYVDLGACGEAVGVEEASAFDGALTGGAIALGVADGKEATDHDKKDGGDKD